MAETVPFDRSSNTWDVSERQARFSNETLFSGDNSQALQSRSSDVIIISPDSHPRFSDHQNAREGMIKSTQTTRKFASEVPTGARCADVPLADQSGNYSPSDQAKIQVTRYASQKGHARKHSVRSVDWVSLASICSALGGACNQVFIKIPRARVILSRRHSALDIMSSPELCRHYLLLEESLEVVFFWANLLDKKISPMLASKPLTEATVEFWIISAQLLGRWKELKKLLSSGGRAVLPSSPSHIELMGDLLDCLKPVNDSISGARYRIGNSQWSDTMYN